MADDGGLRSFQNRMAAIPREVRRAVSPAVVDAAEDVAGLMQELAPEDTGALSASIVVTPPLQSTPAYSQPGGSRVAPPNAALITAGNTNVRYAHLVEFGTARADAQPFFWPGFRLGSKRAADKIKRAIRKAVREAK